MSVRYLSWAQIERASIALAKQLAAQSRPIRAIAAISRGGLVPAAILGYYLKVQVVGAIIPFVVEGKPSSSDNILIVDDICDTGRTFCWARIHYPNMLYAAVYAKPLGVTLTDFWEVMVAQEDWLVFPWAPADEVNR